MRLSRVVPAHTKTVEFYAIKADFAKYTEGWRRVRSTMRNKLDRCGWCGIPFEDGDTIALGFCNHEKNKVLCQACAKKAGDAEDRKE